MCRHFVLHSIDKSRTHTSFHSFSDLHAHTHTHTHTHTHMHAPAHKLTCRRTLAVSSGKDAASATHAAVPAVRNLTANGVFTSAAFMMSATLQEYGT